MPVKGIFDPTIRVLDKVLGLRTQKLEAISANIANAETPGYSRIRVDFETALHDAVNGAGGGQARTHPGHLSGTAGLENFQAIVNREKDLSGIGDRNSVNREQEMVELSENQIRFDAAVRMLSKKFGMLKFVIQEKG